MRDLVGTIPLEALGISSDTGVHVPVRVQRIGRTETYATATRAAAAGLFTAPGWTAVEGADDHVRLRAVDRTCAQMFQKDRRPRTSESAIDAAAAQAGLAPAPRQLRNVDFGGGQAQRGRCGKSANSAGAASARKGRVEPEHAGCAHRTRDADGIVRTDSANNAMAISFGQRRRGAPGERAFSRGSRGPIGDRRRRLLVLPRRASRCSRMPAQH